MKTRSYGSAQLEGYVATDTVCLAKDDTSCIMQFPFFSITKQKGLRPPVEGIVGLA